MSKKSDQEERSDGLLKASFEEKSVWIQLVSLVVVLVAYGWVAGGMLSRGVTHIIPYVPLFGVGVILLVILMIAGHALAAIMGQPEGADERDRLIVWRAESNAGWVLGLGVMLALWGLICSIESVWIAHVLLVSLFLSEIAKLGFQIIYYRRGV